MIINILIEFMKILYKVQLWIIIINNGKISI